MLLIPRLNYKTCRLRESFLAAVARDTFRPMTEPPTIEHDPKRNREPILGPNAKPFAIQFAAAMFMLFAVIPFLTPTLRPYSDGAVNWVLDQFCSIGLCSPEAKGRSLSSGPQ